MADVPFNMSVPLVEQVRIQARVLIPVVKAIQAELGEERANEIVRDALDTVSRKSGQTANSMLKGSPVEKIAASFPVAAAGNALDVEVLAQTPEAFECNVTGCRYAEFFHQLDEPELGFLICCGGDWAMAEGISPDLELTRTQTIMQGAPHCDFRYRLRAAPSS
jgi:hypothetical protein